MLGEGPMRTWLSEGLTRTGAGGVHGGGGTVVVVVGVVVVVVVVDEDDVA
jgi:hypothetical protein